MHTAVSAEVAQAMAEGGLARCPAGLVAASPAWQAQPDEDGKPVGLVDVAAAALDGEHALFGMTSGQLQQDQSAAPLR